MLSVENGKSNSRILLFLIGVVMVVHLVQNIRCLDLLVGVHGNLIRQCYKGPWSFDTTVSSKTH